MEGARLPDGLVMTKVSTQAPVTDVTDVTKLVKSKLLRKAINYVGR
jgi:hypothetical protein